MSMTSVMTSLGRSKRERTSKQNVLKSRSWPWRQVTASCCFYKTQRSEETHDGGEF